MIVRTKKELTKLYITFVNGLNTLFMYNVQLHIKYFFCDGFGQLYYKKKDM